MNWKYVCLLVFVGYSLVGCQQKNPTVNFDATHNYILDQLEASKSELQAVSKATSIEDARAHFQLARKAFKSAEPFAQYFNADNVHKVNGPPLPIFREDNGKVLEPVSLQALDEQLYLDEPLDTVLLNFRIDILNGYLDNLHGAIEQREISPKRFFVPMHLQLLRIFSLSAISFDTPASYHGLQDAIHSLESFKEVYEISIGDTINYIDPQLHTRFLNELDGAIRYVEANNDFDTFDRYQFGREHINALTRSWVEIRNTTGLFDDPKIYAVNLDAPTFFEENSMNPDYFRSSFNKKPTQSEIALGEELFFDKRLSASGNLACATCHDPSKAYQDGLVLGTDKDGNKLKRNTPTLVNSVYQKKFFWDGRSDNLEQQIAMVFETESEFDHAGHSVSLDILKDEDVVANLQTTYKKEKPSRNEIVKALATFTSTLSSFNSRFDRNMRGEISDFTEEEIRGMNLFMGKAVCATCHFLPLTNGTVPPNFAETEKEILGTPETKTNMKVDDDLGFYWVFEEEIHKFMFKTPTLRNIEYTGPYMHNGVYETLEEVMDFYNRGGGGGMGFELDHQTLPFDSLGLDNAEIDAIIAFMKTFSDTTVVPAPYTMELVSSKE